MSIMNSARKCLCSLPPAIKNLCDYGCIYREKAFRHLACKNVTKTECAAPCYPEKCPCNLPKNEKTERIIRKHNEVCLM